jgi:hypothetical protein
LRICTQRDMNESILYYIVLTPNAIEYEYIYELACIVQVDCRDQCCGSGSSGIRNFQQDPDPEKLFRGENF